MSRSPTDSCRQLSHLVCGASWRTWMRIYSMCRSSAGGSGRAFVAIGVRVHVHVHEHANGRLSPVHFLQDVGELLDASLAWACTSGRKYGRGSKLRPGFADTTPARQTPAPERGLPQESPRSLATTGPRLPPNLGQYLRQQRPQPKQCYPGHISCRVSWSGPHCPKSRSADPGGIPGAAGQGARGAGNVQCRHCFLLADPQDRLRQPLSRAFLKIAVRQCTRPLKYFDETGNQDTWPILGIPCVFSAPSRAIMYPWDLALPKTPERKPSCPPPS